MKLPTSLLLTLLAPIVVAQESTTPSPPAGNQEVPAHEFIVEPRAEFLGGQGELEGSTDPAQALTSPALTEGLDASQPPKSGYLVEDSSRRDLPELTPNTSNDYFSGDEPWARPSQAPIGVPLSQRAEEGKYALMLRTTFDSYDGLRDGREDLSSTDAFNRGYTVAPTDRTDERFELEVYYGLSDEWNLFAVIPYVLHNMDQDLSPAGSSSVESSGLGDVQIGGLLRSRTFEEVRLTYLVGLSLPTGEIDANDGTPSARLPYSMQMGSGTFDFLPGVLLETQSGELQIGARLAGRVHLGSANDEGWFRSNSTRVDLWVGRDLTESLRGTLRAQADWWGDVHGSDDELVSTRNPLEDRRRQGGNRVNIYGGLGLDLDAQGTNHIGFEIGLPVEEWLDGPQLSMQWTAVVGWRMQF